MASNEPRVYRDFFFKSFLTIYHSSRKNIIAAECFTGLEISNNDDDRLTGKEKIYLPNIYTSNINNSLK